MCYTTPENIEQGHFSVAVRLAKDLSDEERKVEGGHAAPAPVDRTGVATTTDIARITAITATTATIGDVAV